MKEINSKLIIRKAQEAEFLKVHEFVSNCPFLEKYPEHLYKIVLRYFNNSCFVIEYCDEIIGFTMGFVSQVCNDVYFLWQIGISNDFQNRGFGSKFIKSIENEIKKMGIKKIEVTVNPKNIPSRKLFNRLGYENVSSQESDTVKVNDVIAVKDYYKIGRHFILFRKNII